MLTNDVILDALERVHELVPAVLDGLTSKDIAWQPDPESNSIGWLVWHLVRVEDGGISGLTGADAAWSQGWSAKFALPYDEAASGFGMAADDVRAFNIASPGLLVDYSAEVARRTQRIVAGLTEADYARVVDTHWNPPVTLAVRLVSLVNDMTQHMGQASYVRGLLERSAGKNSGWKGYV